MGGKEGGVVVCVLSLRASGWAPGILRGVRAEKERLENSRIDEDAGRDRAVRGAFKLYGQEAEVCRRRSPAAQAGTTSTQAR